MDASIYRAPVYLETDVLIVGGSSGAVQAAVTLAEAGKRVFLGTSYTYLGEDICASMRYWPDKTVGSVSAAALPAGEKPDPGRGRYGGPLGETLFRDAIESGYAPSPMHVKRSLERALLDVEIPFLYTSYPTHLLRAVDGKVAGGGLANRSGFLAVLAPVVIDATDRALVGRMTGAEFAGWSSAARTLRRVVAGAPPAQGSVRPSGVKDRGGRLESVSELPLPFLIEGRSVPAFECYFSVGEPEIGSSAPGEMARCEVAGRLLTFSPDQVFGSDRVSAVWPDRLAGSAVSGGELLRRPESGVVADGDATASALRCGTDEVYLLSDLGRFDEATRASFYHPAVQLPVARALSARIAAGAHSPPSPSAVTAGYASSGAAGQPGGAGDVKIVRRDRYFRTDDRVTIDIDLNRFPTIGRYLVLVAGGGTAGAPAAISAARAGASTLLIEYLHGLGGVGTEGRIGSYYHGNRVGFSSEIDRGVFGMGPEPDFDIEGRRWNTEWKKQWYLEAAHEAGAEIWFASMAVAAVVRESEVAGAVVATPYGVGIVRADVTVDATGNADVPAAAGAETVNISKDHVAVQGTGLSPFTPGTSSENTDHTFVDDTDVYDTTRAFILAREKFKGAFDLSQLVDSRQRRQIVGELTLDPLDFLAGRTFPDTITTAQSNFDSHGFTIHPLFMAKAPDKEDIRAHVPFRCLLPSGLDGVLSTGLGVSAHRDALPVIRMQADVQNQGYAAGRAAAMTAQTGRSIRRLDVRLLQHHLVQTGVLSPEVAEHSDSFPLPESRIAEAVHNGADSYLDLAVIFGHSERSLPYLQTAYREAKTPELRRNMARILGLLGDDTGIDSLVSGLEAADWDAGWRFTGMGQFGFSLSDIDTLLVAAGRSGNPRAIPAMLEKMKALDAGAELSHIRAATLAFEAQPTTEASPLFARLLRDKRVHGAFRATVSQALSEVSEDRNDTAERNRQLTELLLARGLFACGDVEGIARSVLEGYSGDFHGHYARHARGILEQG